MVNRVGGTIGLKLNGEVFQAKGNFEWHIGEPVREDVIGADGPHGFKEAHTTAMIRGTITMPAGFDARALTTADQVTATLELPTGQVVTVEDGWYAGPGIGTTEEGEFPLEIHGLRGFITG